MSRWFRERLRIGIAPDRVDLARYTLGGRRLLKESSIPVERDAGAAAWRAPVETLNTALAGFGARADSVAVVLSNAFVRYLVLPWQSEVTSARELDELALLRYTRTFGDAVGEWTVRVSAGGYGEASVACAIDGELVTALRACLRAHRLRLVSLQPLLMAAYNDVRGELAGTSALATVEPGRVTLSVMREGAWRAIVSRRATLDAADTVERELAALPPDSAPEEVSVLLVGEGAEWYPEAGRASRVLARSGERGCSLASCGSA